jgi:hypothetical protein
MGKLKKVRDTPQSIETIIQSFEIFALGDIEHNRSNPIAAFILSICFIEQMATLLYKMDADPNKAENFFVDYMPEYKGINLYHKARHTLVHNYSSRYQFDIDHRGFENVDYEVINKVIHINTNVFINHLRNAFEKVKKELDKKEEAYANVLENSMTFPVLVDTYKG